MYFYNKGKKKEGYELGSVTTQLKLGGFLLAVLYYLGANLVDDCFICVT